MVFFLPKGTIFSRTPSKLRLLIVLWGKGPGKSHKNPPGNLPSHQSALFVFLEIFEPAKQRLLVVFCTNPPLSRTLARSWGEQDPDVVRGGCVFEKTAFLARLFQPLPQKTQRAWPTFLGHLKKNTTPKPAEKTKNPQKLRPKPDIGSCFFQGMSTAPPRALKRKGFLIRPKEPKNQNFHPLQMPLQPSNPLAPSNQPVVHYCQPEEESCLKRSWTRSRRKLYGKR